MRAHEECAWCRKRDGQDWHGSLAYTDNRGDNPRNPLAGWTIALAHLA